MELKQLEYFCRVVEAGSISEAARRLNRRCFSAADGRLS